MAAAAAADYVCGAAAASPLIRGWPSPCYAESAAAAVLLLVAAVGAALANAASARWAAAHGVAVSGGGSTTTTAATAMKKSGSGGGGGGLQGRESGLIFASSALALLHSTLAAVSWLALPGAPFAALHHAALALAWLLVASSAAKAARRAHAPMRWLRPALAAALLWYAYAVAADLALYLLTTAAAAAGGGGGGGRGGGGVYPPAYAKSLIWAEMMAAALAALCLLLEVKQAAAAAAAASAGGAYSRLAADDVEAAAAAAAAAAAGEGEGHTWTALFVEACRHAWPHELGLQLRVVACVVLLALMRVLNLAVPITYKRLVDELAAATAAPEGARASFGALLSPWGLAYLAALFFQGGAGGGITGFVNNLRQWLWIPVSQEAYRRVSLEVFGHVLDLDLSFHLTRKTGEVTKVVDRGTAAIQNVLSTILFQIAPQLIDMLAAATYLAGALEPWVALIVFLTIGSYIPLTIIVTEWRGGFRREMNRTENARSARVTDALLNWETVKYFTNEPLEEARYGEAIDQYQGAEYAFLSSLNVLNVVQSGIMFAGIGAGVMACTAGVSRGTLTVGDTVLFLTLMAQLYGPLNFFGTYFRIIQQYMIDMESLLQLLNTPGKVVDHPDARPLQLASGAVEFRDVGFSYERGAMVLKNVSFSAPGGATVAFVGATGSGKSTLTRLLFRFFDVTSGAILIDGQDLRRVTQASLRAVIGMVPQDCVLFNDTIRYNIRYGRMDATDAEVEAAAEAASILEAITTRFPRGFDTVVGERGLRLSGGEKQRVAFARALLKNPPLLVLDEATSALDTITEKRIQGALAATRAARSTFIVAHRLSTIVDADLVVVLKEGAVAEMGTHGELIGAGGLYADLWARQAAGGGGNGDGAGGAGGGVSRPGSTASLPALAEQQQQQQQQQQPAQQAPQQAPARAQQRHHAR